MAQRRIRGDRAFGRLIKQLPIAVENDIRAQLHQSGRMLLSLAQRHVPVRTGALASALSYSIPPKRLSLKVGLVGKALNQKLFYGHIIEFGRKAGGRGVKRGTPKYSAGVGKLPPHHFVYLVTREQMYAPFRGIWDAALRKSAAGASDD
jgi:hypothetical protein